MNGQKNLRCNGCGKTIRMENGLYQEGFFEGRQEWGYFSGKDGERHVFCLCEKCYDRMIQRFVLPVEIEEYL
ncbi:MAG: hypothetical protein LUH00_06355 [Lachnospiraceae bacterium]|nr:hypothetical protein [Lachnospiraceae bacterium]